MTGPLLAPRTTASLPSPPLVRPLARLPPCLVFTPLFIGYGWIAPKTQAGQIFTVVYSIVGIPLVFYMFAYLGRKLMDVIGFRISRLVTEGDNADKSDMVLTMEGLPRMSLPEA